MCVCIVECKCYGNTLITFCINRVHTNSNYYETNAIHIKLEVNLSAG